MRSAIFLSSLVIAKALGGLPEMSGDVPAALAGFLFAFMIADLWDLIK